MPTYRKLQSLVRDIGDTFYVYDEEKFVRNYHEFLSAFRAFYSPTTIAYSYKTNYLPSICERVDRLGGLAEIVSSMEYVLVQTLGVDPSRVIFNGPCKDARTTEEVLLGGGIVNLDSQADLRIVLSIARRFRGNSLRVGLRCNFGDSGLPFSRFGLDTGGEEFRSTVGALRAQRNVELSGLHCHYPSRDLESVRIRTEALLDVCKSLWRDGSPEFLNFGGGFAGRMPPSLRAQFDYAVPTYDDYGACIAGAVADRFPAGTNRPKLFVEPGTAVVADCLTFVTKIKVVKQLRERRIAICGGSIFNTSPTAKSIGLPICVVPKVPRRRGNRMSTDIVGYTCIESDYLAKDFAESVVAEDFIVVENVGSYSLVMKPPFILPNVPVIQWAKGARSGYKIVKRAETPADVLATFPRFTRAGQRPRTRARATVSK